MYATVAQLVEQLIRNQQVGGSNPFGSLRGKPWNFNLPRFFIILAVFLRLLETLRHI